MNRNHRIIVLVVLLVTFAFVAVTFAAGAGKESITFEAKNGKVTFAHKTHQDRVGKEKCNTCHHTSKANGSDAAKCGECHKAEKGEKDGKEVPSMKDAAHKKCKACHEKENAKDTEKKAPTKCTDCHKK